MRTKPRYKRWTQHWRVQSRERESGSVLRFPARRGLAECVGWVSCIYFCIPKALLCLPLFMELFHLMQEPLPKILTSFSGYYSQDVTVMLVESVGDDSWVAEPEQSTTPSLSPTVGPVLIWTDAVVSLLTPLLQLRMLSHVLHEVWVAYFSHPPLGLVFAVSPACSWDEDRDMPPSDCLLLSTGICAPLFSHGLLKALLHSVQGYSLCTLLFFQYWKSLLSQPRQATLLFLSGLFQRDWIRVLFCTSASPGSSPLEHCAVALATICCI